jgi:hypothetical protein
MNAGAWIGAGVAIAAVLGAVAYASSSSSAAQNAPPKATTNTVTLVAGHRYQVTATLPNGLPSTLQGFDFSSVAALQASIDAVKPGTVRIVSLSRPDATHVVLVFDMLVAISQSVAPNVVTVSGATQTVTSGPNSAAIVDQGPAPSSSPQSSAWTRTTTINPGDVVRVSMTQQDLDTVVALIPGATADLAGFQTLISAPATLAALGLLGGHLVAAQVWGPGQALPSDWPPDDTQAALEYHAQFNYPGAGPVNVGIFPIPLQFWTMPGLGIVQSSIPNITRQSNGQTLNVAHGAPIAVSLTPPAQSNWYVRVASAASGGGAVNIGLMDPQGWALVHPGQQLQTTQAGTVVLEFEARDMQGATVDGFSVAVNIT